MADDRSDERAQPYPGEIPGQLPLFDQPEDPEQYDPSTDRDPMYEPDDADEAGPPREQTKSEELGGFASEVLQGRLEKLVADNRTKHQRLIAAGSVPNPQAILLMRIETLLDLTLTPAERLRFDVLFETRMSVLLDRLLAEQARGGLLVPATGPGPRSGPTGTGLLLPPH